MSGKRECKRETPNRYDVLTNFLFLLPGKALMKVTARERLELG